MIGGAALGQKRRSTPYVLQGLPAQLRIDSVSEMSVETTKPSSWWEANWEVGLFSTVALDSETKQQIETLFAMLDRDKDGALTQEDFYLASSDARTNHHKNSIETARDALLQREVDTARTRISARKPSQRNKPPAFIHHHRRRLPRPPPPTPPPVLRRCFTSGTSCSRSSTSLATAEYPRSSSSTG